MYVWVGVAVSWAISCRLSSWPQRSNPKPEKS